MALQPIDYGMQVQNPLQAAREGSAFGLKMADYYNQQKLAEEKRQQEALQRQKMKADLMKLADNPSAENYTKYITLYPQFSEQLKRGYDVMSDGQKQRATEASTQTALLFDNGDVESAKKLLNDYALAYENAGDSGMAASYKSIAKIADIDPKKAKASVLLLAGRGLSGDQAAEFWSKLGKEQREQELQPYAVGQAGANIQKTQLENEWLPKTNQANINNIDSQIEDRAIGRAIENKQVENQNRQFYANLDQSQKQFLMKLDQDERKLANDMNPNKPEQAIDRVERLSKVEDYESAVLNAKNAAKNAADLANDFNKISDATGGYWNRAMRNIPGTSEHSFAQKLETLKSQVFLTQIAKMKGMGALTDQEGARLEKSIDSLDADLDPKVLQKNLRNIETELTRASNKAQRMAELYATRGTGYSDTVIQAAKKRGVTPYEMQKIANEMGY